MYSRFFSTIRRPNRYSSLAFSPDRDERNFIFLVFSTLVSILSRAPRRSSSFLVPCSLLVDSFVVSLATATFFHDEIIGQGFTVRRDNLIGLRATTAAVFETRSGSKLFPLFSSFCASYRELAAGIIVHACTDSVGESSQSFTVRLRHFPDAQTMARKTVSFVNWETTASSSRNVTLYICIYIIYIYIHKHIYTTCTHTCVPVSYRFDDVDL